MSGRQKLWKSRVSLQRTRDKHKSRFDLQNDRGQEKNDNAAMHVRARTLNEAFPVLKLYYNPTQSSQDPKREVVQQPGTIQPGPQTRHVQY